MQAVLAAAEHDAQWQEQDIDRRSGAIWLTLERGEYRCCPRRGQRAADATCKPTTLCCYPWRAEIGTRFWQMHMHRHDRRPRRGSWVTTRPQRTHSEAASRPVRRDGRTAFQGAQLARDRYARCGCAATTNRRGPWRKARWRSVDSFGDHISAAYGELTLGADRARRRPTARWPASTAGAAWRWRWRPASIALHVRSLVALARIERMLGHLAAARRRLNEALSACTQPGITHIDHLAAVMLELGHARLRRTGLAAGAPALTRGTGSQGLHAAEAQDARAGLAEVAWAEGDRAQAEQLLTAVIGDPATAVATRKRAEQSLMRWGIGAGAAG